MTDRPQCRSGDGRQLHWHGAEFLLLAGGVAIEVVQIIPGDRSRALTPTVWAPVQKQASGALGEAASVLVSLPAVTNPRTDC